MSNVYRNNTSPCFDGDLPFQLGENQCFIQIFSSGGRTFVFTGTDIVCGAIITNVGRDATRHERDQSFPVPVPARKKFWSRSRSSLDQKKKFGPGPSPGEKKILVPVTARKSFRSRSRSR
jgi:hypothetical protein